MELQDLGKIPWPFRKRWEVIQKTHGKSEAGSKCFPSFVSVSLETVGQRGHLFSPQHTLVGVLVQQTLLQRSVRRRRMPQVKKSLVLLPGGYLSVPQV